jgi:hypothetical protein
MSRPASAAYTAPVFLGTAIFVFVLAIVEKTLNLVGGSIPIVTVFPRQLLDWAVVLLMFEIALSLRVLSERLLAQSEGDGQDPSAD